MVQGEMLVSMKMDKSEGIQSIFWRQNKWTLLKDWIFFWNLQNIFRVLFSGRIYINPDFIGIEM